MTAMTNNVPPKKKEASETSRNALNAQQKFKVAQELVGMEKEVREAGMSRDEVARIMTERLKFTVTNGNVLTAQQMTGIRWKPRTGGGSAGSKYGTGFKYRTAVLVRQVAALRRAVMTLCARLGESVPDDVADAAWEETGVVPNGECPKS
jgi:hypothetical protein